MSESIDNLLNTGVIEECFEHDLEVISPLGVVPKKNNKLRLILDLRHVNSFLADQKFKIEDLRLAAILFQPGFELFTLDLKDG